MLISALIRKKQVKTTSIVKKSSDDVKELTNQIKNESYFILFISDSIPELFKNKLCKDLRQKEIR